MSKVIRISDYTEQLMKEYYLIIEKLMKQYDFDSEILIKSDDQIIQSALLNVIRAKKEEQKSK